MIKGKTADARPPGKTQESLPRQTHRLGKTTTRLALQFDGEWVRQGQCVASIDADPHGSALDLSELRAREALQQLFEAVGLTRNTLSRKAQELARALPPIIIGGPQRVAGVMPSVLLAVDVALILVHPMLVDRWASNGLLKPIDQARVFRLRLVARFMLDRRDRARLYVARQPRRWPITSRQSSPISSDNAWPAWLPRYGPLVSHLAEHNPVATEMAVRAAEAGKMAR